MKIKMCVNCWERFKMCKCGDNKRIELIDKHILDILMTLNSKEFKTLHSCGGHIDDKIINVYVSFAEFYYFKSIPLNFTYKMKNNQGLLAYICKDSKKKIYTNAERKEAIKKQIIILKDWVNEL